MKLSVFFLVALLLDIIANGAFRAMLTDCTDIVAITPELAAPQLLFHAWHTGKDFTCGQAFDYLHDLGGAIAGYRLNQKMHMVTVRADFQKHQFVALGDVQAHSL